MLRHAVLIPAKDEELVIAHSIESILLAGISPEDVYVVDDGSHDNTAEIARTFGVWVLRNRENMGKALSIDRAVKYFQLVWCYDLISLVDADTRVNANYFKVARRIFRKDTNTVVVCGKVKSLAYNWLTAYRCYVYFVTHGIYKNGQTEMGVVTVVPGCAATYRASIFPSLEWNNDTLVEDADVTMQVHLKKLGNVVYNGEAFVYTQDPKAPGDYAKQMFRWYQGAWQIVNKHKAVIATKKIKAETMLLMGEGLLFSILAALTPIWLYLFPKATLWVIGIDWIFMMAMCLITAIVERRKEVVFYGPVFQFVRFIDCLVLLYAFWCINIRKKRSANWLFVNRYKQSPEA